MPRDRKSQNKGYKIVPMDTAKPFSKVGEKPCKPDPQAKAMFRTALSRSPQGSAKLRAPKMP